VTSRGTKQHPAVVRVRTEERAHEVLVLCEEHGIQVIVGIEPDKTEEHQRCRADPLATGTYGGRSKAWPERPLPVRLWQEIQEVLCRASVRGLR
jgi:hypothetical protein